MSPEGSYLENHGNLSIKLTNPLLIGSAGIALTRGPGGRISLICVGVSFKSHDVSMMGFCRAAEVVSKHSHSA